MSVEAWELVFMMVVLKLPIAYLIGVVVWAVRAVPDPYEPAALVRERPQAPAGPETPLGRCPWQGRRRSPPRRRRTASVGAR